MDDPDPSAQDWRTQLLNSLKGTGRLDTLKSQLRARLVDQLRDQDGTLLEFKGNRKPSVTERILTSLFQDYLRSNGFSFTQSVFLPESQSVAWPALTFQEMLHLLHLNPAASWHQNLKIVRFLKHQMSLLRPLRSKHQELEALTNGTPRQRLSCTAASGCPPASAISHRLPGLLDSDRPSVSTRPCLEFMHADSCLREIDDTCFQHKAAENRTTFRSLEERLNTFRQEFEARVDAEVALQVNRIREYETHAVRVEEEARYRRQLAREREELEQTHKARLERIREREESLTERLVSKEKAIQTSAFEERQKFLERLADLTDREEGVTKREDLQKKLKDALEEREKILSMKEADVAQREGMMHEQAEKKAELKIKETEEQYKSCQEQLQIERNLLEAERANCREDKARLGSELAAVKSDRDLVHSLNERLATDEKRRMELVNSLLERLNSEEEERKLLLKKIDDITLSVECTAKSSVQDTRDLLQDDRNENTAELWDERSLDKVCKYSQQLYRSCTKDRNRVQQTIKELERAVQEAEAGREIADHARRAIQLQLKSSDSELLETVSLLKKTQHALELERLHHYSLRSQLASVFSLSSQSRVRLQDTPILLDPGYVLGSDAHLKTCCGSGPIMDDLRAAKSFEGDRLEDFCQDQDQENRGQLSWNDTVPCAYQTDYKLGDPSPADRRPSLRSNQTGTAMVTCHQEGFKSSDNNPRISSICTQNPKGMFDRDRTNSGCQLDDLAVVDVDGLEKKHFAFHRGSIGEASPAFSSCISGINREQASGKWIGSKTGESHRDEQAESSLYQHIPGTEAADVLVQITSRPSEAGLALSIPESRTDYNVLEAHSTRSRDSQVDILVNRKTVKHSSVSDNPIEQSVQTNIDKKGQTTAHCGSCRNNQGCSSGDQKDSNSADPDCREASRVRQVYISEMNTRTCGRGFDYDAPAFCESELTHLDSADRQKPIIRHAKDVSVTITDQLGRKRLHGDDALYKLSCKNIDDEVRQSTLNNHQHTSLHGNASDEEGEEKEIPAQMQLGTPLSNQVRSLEIVHKGSYTSEPSKQASQAESLLNDFKQWLTNKTRLESSPKYSEHQQRPNAEWDTSEAPPGDKELRQSTSRPLLRSEELQRLPENQQGGDIVRISQHAIAEAARPNRSKSSSQTSASDSLKKIGILRGGASSDESFSSPMKRTSSVKSVREVSESRKMALEEPPYWEDSQQVHGQHGDEESSEQSRVRSEQGSYTPGEGGTVEWIDDFPTAANSNYLDNSDAFSGLGSDIYLSDHQ